MLFDGHQPVLRPQQLGGDQRRTGIGARRRHARRVRDRRRVPAGPPSRAASRPIPPAASPVRSASSPAKIVDPAPGMGVDDGEGRVLLAQMQRAPRPTPDVSSRRRNSRHGRRGGNSRRLDAARPRQQLAAAIGTTAAHRGAAGSAECAFVGTDARRVAVLRQGCRAALATAAHLKRHGRPSASRPGPRPEGPHRRAAPPWPALS